MRRGRIFIYLALILILGVVAVGVVYFRFLQPATPVVEQQVEATPVDIVNVVVTTQQVPRGASIDAQVLGLVPIQRELFIQGMFTDINAVEGRLAKFDLEAGIPLTSGMLVDRAEDLSAAGSDAALSIPRGMVAVSIPIDRLSSVSYAPKPGDHVNVIVNLLLVDLDTDFQSILPNNAGLVIAPGAEGEPLTAIVSGGGGGGAGEGAAQPGVPIGKAEVIPGLGQSVYSVPSERQRPRLVSQNLLQDAVVLQVGSFALEDEEQQTPSEAQQPQVTPTPPPGGEALQQAPTPKPPPDVITLIVTPQDAITLNYLLYSGAKMNLALRASGDDTRVQTEAVTLQFLLDQYNIPVPVKLPYGLEPRVNELVQPKLQPTATPAPQE